MLVIIFSFLFRWSIMSVESSSVSKDTNEVRDDGNLQTSHGRLSFNTETLLYVVSPYDYYYYYVKTLTTYVIYPLGIQNRI
jgi:hypothetical protein